MDLVKSELALRPNWDHDLLGRQVSEVVEIAGLVPSFGC